MQNLPLKLKKSLESRKNEESFRSLGFSKDITDFSSNDYLGCASSQVIFSQAHEILVQNKLLKNGATGSRLLTGNYPLYEKTESFLAEFHQTEAALIFNSGYDANIGFFSSVPQRGDIIFYDELVHASIRVGISMSHAKAYKFRHNNLEDLRNNIARIAEIQESTAVYIVTESVFSMDGDTVDLISLADFAGKNKFLLIVDEAHATGVFGKKGRGLVQESKIREKVFARINTFGKALGCHGAVVLGSKDLKDYLINFSRSFIYTTALPPHAVATILAAYRYLDKNQSPLKELKQNIDFFKAQINENKLRQFFISSDSQIHCCFIPGNENIKKIAQKLEKQGFEVKPILSPTVPKGKERLRFCVHSYNTKEEIAAVLKLLYKFVSLS